MDILEEARKFRAFIETMAESVDDETAKSHKDVFPLWKENTEYVKDFRVRYNEVLYKVLQDHTSQSDWTPNTAVSLYVRVDDPTIEFPEWIQPTGAHDAYPKDYKVSHNGKHWISLIDANVWEPSEEASTLWENIPIDEEPDEPVEEEYPEWVQPTAENPYMAGDKVTFEGEHYISLIDNNVWSPADYPAGWQLVE